MLCTLKLCVVQSLDCIHGLVRVRHMYKSKILDNSTLCDCAVLLKESTQLVIGSLLYVGYMEFDGALVLPVAGLHVNWSAMKLVEVQAFDGFGGGLAVIHVDEGVVLDDGTFCDCAVLCEERLDFILVCLPGQIPHKNFHHCLKTCYRAFGVGAGGAKKKKRLIKTDCVYVCKEQRTDAYSLLFHYCE